MPQNQTFTHESHFHFNECDPAGIFYFGNVPSLCHKAYENWLVSLKKEWNYWFNNPEWIIPVKNCQVDYLSPMRAGEPFQIQLSVGQMSQTSFTSAYHAFHPTTKVSYFKAQIVHVFVNKSTFKKSTIPTLVRPLFDAYLQEGALEDR